jgi:large subunit ribosomal protein L22
MISKAVAKYLRISPRKVRVVIDLIKGRNAISARGILSNTNKKAAAILLKVLNSAIANAKRIPNMREEDLYICDLRADGGPMLKRFKAQAMGRAAMIKRRTSHITLKLDTRESKISEKPFKINGKTIKKKLPGPKPLAQKAKSDKKIKKEDTQKKELNKE